MMEIKVSISYNDSPLVELEHSDDMVHRDDDIVGLGKFSDINGDVSSLDIDNLSPLFSTVIEVLRKRVEEKNRVGGA